MSYAKGMTLVRQDRYSIIQKVVVLYDHIDDRRQFLLFLQDHQDQLQIFHHKLLGQVELYLVFIKTADQDNKKRLFMFYLLDSDGLMTHRLLRNAQFVLHVDELVQLELVM